MMSRLGHAALVVLALGAGCRKGAPASATPADPSSDDLASMQAELARNAAELGSLGVSIAKGGATAAVDEESPTPIGASKSKKKREENLKRGTKQRPRDGGDGGDDRPTKPIPGPRKPEPKPTTEDPTTDPTPDPTTDPTEDPAEDPTLDPTKNPTTTPTTEPSGGGPSGEPESVSAEACGRICGLASVACELSDRICTLAVRHTGDARYEDACWNAKLQCETATDACDDCDPETPGACETPA